MNNGHDYTALADAIGDAIDGQREANAFLLTLRTNLGDGDELFYALRGLTGCGNDARVCGFCRTLQKQLEAAQRSLQTAIVER